MIEVDAAEPGGWAERARALVQARCTDGTARIGAVVCPRDRALAGRLSRHAVCNALFRTPAGAVWMLRTVGHAWTSERVTAAAELLSWGRSAEGRVRNPTLGTRLARALELPRVDIVAPTLDRIDPGQWETRKLAITLRMQHVGGTSPAPEPAVLAEEVAAIEAAMLDALEQARRGFVDGLDREVLDVAPGCLADADRYNFAADLRHRRNRLQLAAAFPLFLPAAASGDADGAGALIRRVVDTGLPLVDTLARQWGVSASVLRGLRGRTVAEVGPQWAARLEALVTVLNTLPAEFRPGADPAAWRAFNEHLAFAEQAFGRQPWTSPLLLAWLRNAARAGWAAGAFTELGGEARQEAVAAVDVLRQAMIGSLMAEIVATDDDHGDAGFLSARASHVVDGHLALMAPRRLLEVARRYRRELASARVELADEIAVAEGAGYWPLLPDDYVSHDRSRVVVSLRDRRSLALHGRALANCLGEGSLAHYASACTKGNTFIVAVLDARTRQPLSTAELRLLRPARAGPPEVLVAQHTAARNAEPMPQCRAALREAIACLRTEGGREHLRKGLKISAARQGGERYVRQDAERLAIVRTIGKDRYESLLQAAR